MQWIFCQNELVINTDELTFILRYYKDSDFNKISCILIMYTWLIRSLLCATSE